jgi:hypothetical protein
MIFVVDGLNIYMSNSESVLISDIGDWFVQSFRDWMTFLCCREVDGWDSSKKLMFAP